MRALLQREGARLLPDGRLFDEVLRADFGAGDTLVPGCFEAFLLHDHYVWHSARLRTAYGTVELRPACQQPPHEAMAAAALYLGLVEGRAEIRTTCRARCRRRDTGKHDAVPPRGACATGWRRRGRGGFSGGGADAGGEGAGKAGPG